MERGFQHVGVDEDRKHAASFIIGHKSHAAYVSSEIVHVPGVLGGNLALFEPAAIELEILSGIKNLLPLRKWLNIYSAYLYRPAMQQAGDEVAADEPTGSRNHNRSLCHISGRLG